MIFPYVLKFVPIDAIFVPLRILAGINSYLFKYQLVTCYLFNICKDQFCVKKNTFL